MFYLKHVIIRRFFRVIVWLFWILGTAHMLLTLPQAYEAGAKDWKPIIDRMIVSNEAD